MLYWMNKCPNQKKKHFQHNPFSIHYQHLLSQNSQKKKLLFHGKKLNKFTYETHIEFSFLNFKKNNNPGNKNKKKSRKEKIILIHKINTHSINYLLACLLIWWTKFILKDSIGHNANYINFFLLSSFFPCQNFMLKFQIC